MSFNLFLLAASNNVGGAAQPIGNTSLRIVTQTVETFSFTFTWDIMANADPTNVNNTLRYRLKKDGVMVVENLNGLGWVVHDIAADNSTSTWTIEVYDTQGHIKDSHSLVVHNQMNTNVVEVPIALPFNSPRYRRGAVVVDANNNPN